jgi:hypothetical protein
MAPRVRLVAAERLGAPVDAVRVWMVAHHALGPVVLGRAVDKIPPYFLRVMYGGQDVTDSLGAEALLRARFPRTSGPPGHFLTASTAVRLIRALLSHGGALLHAPAPNGLPGGYPVVVGDGRVEPAPIDGLTLAEAVEINRRSHRFDGIERIEYDGTVVFCPEAVEALRAELGYVCERLPPDECEARAVELIARFREYAARHGVDFDARWPRMQ